MRAEKLSTDGAPQLTSVAQTLQRITREVGDWDKWRKRQRDGKPIPLRKLLSANALFWGQPTELIVHQPTTARLLRLKANSKESDFDWQEAAQDWISAVKEPVTLQVVLEGIAWALGSPALTNVLPESNWKELVAVLMAMTCNPQQDHAGSDRPDAIIQFLVSCELPMALAYAQPELCRGRQAEARAAFSDCLNTMLDGEGTPHATHLSSLQMLVASCTRSLTLDVEIRKGRISKPARLQFDWMCRQLLRWSRPDGTPILGTQKDSPFFDEMLKSALKITRDDLDLAAHKLFRGKRKSTEDELPECTEHSEWSETATMRTSWSSSAARLAVTFPTGRLDAELAIGREAIFSGSCLPRIVADERSLSPLSDWDEVCWETDDDMDYIEVECPLTNGWTLQRQFLLARRDCFALISDVILGQKTAELSYQQPLPLCEGVILEQAEENTEAMILGEKRLGTVIPLGLSEWKSGLGDNRLRVDPARLEVRARCKSLYAPLFIDLDPTRRGKALTWRQLTVAENLQPTSSEVAVAYRVQIGKKQWVIYRSLEKPGNRTFLGINLTSEFLVARFKPDGETETLIDVTG